MADIGSTSHAWWSVMSAETVRTIRLYGPLGTRFGRIHRFAVSNAVEAIRALCAMVPGFERELMNSKARGIGYAIFLGKRNISEAQLLHPPGADDIRIAPMLTGAKRGGVLNIIAGVALIAVAVFFPPAAAGYFGISALSAAAVGGLGVSLALGGIAQLLAPQIGGLSGVNSPDNGASYNFNGPVNVTAQGNPWPLGLGQGIGGSAVVSAGLYSQDQQ